ncbi:MAG: MFS transporter [Candidatus Saccharimonadales bacterium]
MTKQQRLVIIVSILASFVSFLDGSVVNVALPAIAKELGGGLVTQQWVVDAYLITLGALIMVAGSLSDLFGRKRILRAGLIGFGITSILCAVAPSSAFLILSRGLQGVFGALLVPSSLALIISTFSGKEQGKAIGTWTAWTGMAFIFGPLLGGFFVDTLSWRWIFAINVVPIVVTLWLMRWLSQADPAKKVGVDVLGAGLCAVGLGSTVYALIEQSHYGWSSPQILVPLVVGLLLLAAFIWHESKDPEPMLPLSLFKVRNFAYGNLATLAIYGGLSVAMFLVVVFVQQVAGYSAIQAGLTLMPVTLIMFFLSSRFGALSSTYGPRLFMTLGPIIGAAGFLLMLRAGAHVHYWTELFPGVVVFGLGLSITVAPLTSAILGSIDSSHAGIGSAVNNAVARIAGLIAIAGVGLVIGSTLTTAGFHNGLIATAALLAAGGIISGFGIRNNQLTEN